MKDFFPICTGACSNYTTQAICESLYRQTREHLEIEWSIHRMRMAYLTPSIMRRELSDLGERIERAMRR